jgi:Ca2+-binding EF-hand superfamily protein
VNEQQTTMAAEKKKALEDVFNMFDKDGSGKIDASELKAAVKEFYSVQNQTVDEGQIDADVGAILKACDTTQDGKIDKNEWFKFFEV